MEYYERTPYKMTKEEFENVTELLGASFIQKSNGGSSKVRFYFEINETVTAQIDCTAIEGKFYGRYWEDVTEIRINDIHTSGKGSRKTGGYDQGWKMVKELVQ